MSEARATVAKKPRKWIAVKVSARLLHWPQMCASCCGSFEIVRKVLFAHIDSRNRRQDRWWDVPYCLKCHDDIEGEIAGEMSCIPFKLELFNNPWE